MPHARRVPPYVIAWMGLLLLSFGLTQDEDDLYEPAPPPDSAFVRLVTPHAGVGRAFVGDVPFALPEAGGATPYRVVGQGAWPYGVGGAEGTLEIEAGNFYTLSLVNDRVSVFEDAAVEDRARASLTFYNLTDGPLSLMTRDGETPVLPDVAAGEHGHVEVNPVDVAFAVFDADGAVADVEGLRLARGRAFAVFAFPAGEEDGIAATPVAATTETE